MKIHLSCMTCQFADTPFFITSETLDDGVYRFQCRNGHETFVISQHQKFETLFEMGLDAIVDGYYLETVSAIASSLERFYELYIRVVSRKYKLSQEELERAWKHVSNQSERQLGCYIACHLIHTKTCPVLLSDTWIKFRNATIHKGTIPSRAKTIDYSNTVLNVIIPVLIEIKTSLREEIAMHYGLSTEMRRMQYIKPGESVPLAIWSGGFTLCAMTVTEIDYPADVGMALEKLKRRRSAAWKLELLNASTVGFSNFTSPPEQNPKP